MSQVRAGEQVITTTSTYAPGTTAYRATDQVYSGQGYAQGGERAYVQGGERQTTYVQPGQTSYEYASVPQYAMGQQERTTVVRGGEVRGEGSKAVAADIPVESRIEYIPFEKKYMEYEQVEKVFQVPVEYEEVEYEEVVRNERVPYERTITDYYAVETQVEYIRREVEETVMVEEPVERTFERVQYIPVETQIVHYPERDNYVAAPTKTRTEYLGIVEGGYKGGETVVVNNNNNYAAPVEGRYTETRVENRGYETRPVENRVETRYVENRPIETRVASSNYVGSGSGAGNASGATYTYTGSNNYPASSTAGYTTTTGYGAPVASSSYQTGYVTGGSGVRGSGVRGATYETQVIRN